MRKLETHFDQISLEIVKGTAKPNARDEKPAQKTTKRIQTSTSKLRGFSSRRKTKDESRNLAMKLSMNKRTDEPIPYPEWQRPLLNALLELDDKKLGQRVADAEAAISRRLELIARDPKQLTERLAIEDALASLRILKKISAPPDEIIQPRGGDGGSI